MWIRKSSTSGSIVNLDKVEYISLVYSQWNNEPEIKFQLSSGNVVYMPGDADTLDTLWFLLGTRDLTILLPKTETDS